jgi:hypothetical protein
MGLFKVWTSNSLWAFKTQSNPIISILNDFWYEVGPADGQLAVKCFDCQISGKLAVKILEEIELSSVLPAKFLDNSQSTSTNISKNSQLRGGWSGEFNFLDKN